MTRHNLIAICLYNEAVTMKKVDEKFLNKKKNISKLVFKLSSMLFLTACISQREISDEQAEMIVSEVKSNCEYYPDDIAQMMKYANDVSDFSSKYYDLIFKMEYVLALCLRELKDQSKGYKERVKQYILGFHNLPRAFLAVEDRLRIHPNDAWEYSRGYFENQK